MTLLRIWRTRIEIDRAEEYERFARERSLPMFETQDGFVGVMFGRSGADCVTATLWRDRDAVRRLESSASYRRTVAEISETGFLLGDATVEVYDLHGTHLRTPALHE